MTNFSGAGLAALAGFAGLGILSGGTLRAATPIVPSATTASRRPNIIVIVADDLGYADVGIQGQSKDVKTPNIDTIARNGVRFTSGYVSCPVCSPTRAGLLTGRYQQRFGHELNPPPPPATGFGLPLDQILLPQILKQAGYATAMFGKWHLGMGEGYRPWERGFDEYFGFLHGQHAYFDLTAKGGGGGPNGGDAIIKARAERNSRAEPVPSEGYLTRLFAREAVGFIGRHQAEPFFLYLPFNAVHVPLEAPKEYLDEYEGTEETKRKTMLAMLSALDEAVGQILAEVRAHGLEDDTLIFFISDNGGYAPNSSRNDPFRGFKTDLLEGGIREPFFVQWKNHIPPGQVVDSPVIQLDIFATAVAAAHAPAPADRVMDGVNLLPFLTGAQKGAVHEYLFWRFGAQKAVRHDNYKLSLTPKHGTLLIDLATDIQELQDLSKSRPEIFAELKSALDNWEKQLVPPTTVRGRNNAKGPSPAKRK